MTRSEILEAARQAVTKDRAATHGKPENTFGLIAALWSARLGQTIKPSQVAIMMIDLKTARAWGNPAHGDSWTDIAGYAACGGELAGQENIALGEALEIIKAEAAAKAAGWYLEDGILRLDHEGVPARAIAYDGPKSWLVAAMNAKAEEIEKQNAARTEPEPDRCDYCGAERPDDFRLWSRAHLCDSCETKRAFGMEKEGGETRTASMGAIKDMIAQGEVKPPIQDAPEDDQNDDLPEGFWDGAVLMPPLIGPDGKLTMTESEHMALVVSGGIQPSVENHLSPDQSPVAVVDLAEGATAEALAQDNAKPETPAPSLAPEAEKRHHAAKWTPEMDAKLIGGIAVRVANGMSRTAAASATAKEIGMGEKACVVRQQNQLLARVTDAIGLAKAAKDTAADLAKTMAPAKKAPATQPLSKRLSTPPHVALNIDMHLAECRADGWAYADDLHLFEMVVGQGYGMGDVALDMGRDSKAIKDRYDRLTGIYQDSNSKWCRKYMRDDVLAALRRAAKEEEGVK